MRKLILVAHNIRSTHNIGSLLRTADGFGVGEVILSGYSPYPEEKNDSRLPHIYRRLTKQINKTALGAETTVKWRHISDLANYLQKLKKQGYTVCALEQAKGSVNLADYMPGDKIALVAGSETSGLDSAVLDLADTCLEIPMAGQKESFNVAVAVAIALYALSLP